MPSPPTWNQTQAAFIHMQHCTDARCTEYNSHTLIRRKFVIGCPTCDYIRSNAHSFGPPHDASTSCESGRGRHCACSNCF